MIEPNALYEKAMDAAEDWADKEYAYGILDDALATLEGQLCAEYKANKEAATLIPKIIKADHRWIDMAGKVRDAKKEYALARFKYEQVNRYQDNVRTKETTERQLAR